MTSMVTPTESIMTLSVYVRMVLTMRMTQTSLDNNVTTIMFGVNIRRRFMCILSKIAM